ncbi:MAG: ABC transporter permease [Bdellovibrionaceae bacterium]|nr:ABC transporter permease [Pseudobdellovibrionaceae bacterium]
MLGTSTLLFVLFHFVGGDPVLTFAGKNADAATIAQLRQDLGFSGSLLQQYVRFTRETFLWDWGTSWVSHGSVLKRIGEGLGPSLTITLPGFLIAYFLALLLAFLAVHYFERWPDTLLQFIVSFLMSVSFVVLILFCQKIFAYDLAWFPVYGWDHDIFKRWSYAALPIAIFTLATFPAKVLVIRSLIAEEIEKKYVLTARAKGVFTHTIYFSHVLKNILPGVFTMMWAQVPALLTGSLLLEAFFGIPGLGNLLLNSIQASDFPVVKALTVMGSIIYIVCVFIGDVLIFILDPRLESK